ncbi:hypothetical protein ACQP3J_31525, partial [Escherichia coli]
PLYSSRNHHCVLLSITEGRSRQIELMFETVSDMNRSGSDERGNSIKNVKGKAEGIPTMQELCTPPGGGAEEESCAQRTPGAD